MPANKTFLSWSSGKDAAFSLWRLIQSGQKPDLLLTTVNRDYGRVSMHGLRIELLRLQSRRAGIPLLEIPLSADVDMETYNRTMAQYMQRLKSEGFGRACFGDIFLEDLKQYRIRQMASAGFSTCFPVWGEDTRRMGLEIIRSGIKAVVVTVNADKLDRSFVGREYDESFLSDLPPGVDPCGENGEFHTFVYDAPFFDRPIPYLRGETVFRSYKPCKDNDRKNFDDSRNGKPRAWDTGFWYCDILPGE